MISNWNGFPNAVGLSRTTWVVGQEEGILMAVREGREVGGSQAFQAQEVPMLILHPKATSRAKHVAQKH